MRKLHTLLKKNKSKFANNNDDTNEVITENWEAFYYSNDLVNKELNVENVAIGILTIAVCFLFIFLLIILIIFIIIFAL
jgi:hypothetical protein